MWRWGLASEVKAIAGFSVVPKKDPQKQRTLLMQRLANYWWSDCRRREELGMLGGTSMATVHAETGCIAAATFDESNAFTSVLTPQWIWGWCRAPPIVAPKVWFRLSLQLTSRISPSILVFPQYMRLAMGSSHSVHLLMNVNFITIGRTLLDSHRIKSPEQDKHQIADVLPSDVMEDQQLEPEPEALAESAETADDV